MSALVQHSTLTDPDIHEPKGASTAANGEVLTADGAGGTFFGPASGAVFGSDYQTAVDLPRETTTSAVFQTKVALTTPPLTGTYRVGWHAVVDQSNASDAVQAQLANITD